MQTQTNETQEKADASEFELLMSGKFMYGAIYKLYKINEHMRMVCFDGQYAISGSKLTQTLFTIDSVYGRPIAPVYALTSQVHTRLIVETDGQVKICNESDGLNSIAKGSVIYCVK